MCVCSVASDSETPWTVAHQAPLSLGFPRQGYWSVLQFPPPGDLHFPGSNPGRVDSCSTPGSQVQPLIGELRSFKPCDTTRKKPISDVMGEIILESFKGLQGGFALNR